MNAPARIDMVLDSEDLTAAEAALLDFCDPVALDPATSAKLAKLGKRRPDWVCEKISRSMKRLRAKQRAAREALELVG